MLYIRLVYHSHKEEQCRKEIAGLYNMIKQFAQSALITMTKNKNFSFDLRIFVPEVSVSRWLKATLMRKQKEKWFVIRNIEPFAKKDNTEHLKFRVEPAAQGLVGSAFSSGSIVYDDNLESTNSTEYSLPHSQMLTVKSWQGFIRNIRCDSLKRLGALGTTIQADIYGNRSEYYLSRHRIILNFLNMCELCIWVPLKVAF